MLPVFFVENQSAILFYTILILFIIAVRRKIDWQTFGIGMYRTKVGLKLMNTLGTRYMGLVQVLGLIGIGVGFIGMAAMLWVLGVGFVEMFLNPAAAPVVSPVVPGFKIIGHDLHVPLITGWLALFVVIVVHEFSHGVVSIAYKIPVKSSGLLVFGPIGGAFVEPEEKKLVKESPAVQYSLFAAGPWSNVLSAGILALLLIFLVTPSIADMTSVEGMKVMSVDQDMPAEGVLEEGMIIHTINDQSIATAPDIDAVFSEVQPGDEISLLTDRGVRSMETTGDPDDEARPYMGITVQPNLVPKRSGAVFGAFYTVLRWFQEFLNWVIILSLGIGLANLLPLGPVDGGRMFQMAARQITGSEKRGDWWWKKVSILTLALLLILLVYPIGRMFL